ncbi:MAG: Sua5/YciO/YrdC/YwlC family protein [Candidatus Saccharimonas sp.]
MKRTVQEAVAVLARGGSVIARTDTLYGVLARADDEMAVASVYRIKNRTPHKSCIVLIAKPEHAYAPLPPTAMALFTEMPTSLLVDSPMAPAWLLRENQQVAYRIPVGCEWLLKVLELTGPLIAPSANPEGQLPATRIAEAKAYFGTAIQLYVDGGMVEHAVAPSRLVRLQPNGQLQYIR